MEPAKVRTPRLVAVGRHLLPCLSASDFLALGEQRWHSLHTRAQEMLEDARADSEQRVKTLEAVYAKRDQTASLALELAATLDGAAIVIARAFEKANIQGSDVFDTLDPEATIRAAVGLCGVDLNEKQDPK